MVARELCKDKYFHAKEEKKSGEGNRPDQKKGSLGRDTLKAQIDTFIYFIPIQIKNIKIY